MFKRLAGILIPIVLVSLPFALKFLSQEDLPSSTASSDARLIKWKELGVLDYGSDQIPESIQNLFGSPVRIAGFAVSFEDDAKKVKEFLLVPSPMSCIHVPPPPPNQLIHVKLEEEISALDLIRPVWVEGNLKVVPLEGRFAKQGFEMMGQKIEAYRASSF